MNLKRILNIQDLIKMDVIKFGEKRKQIHKYVIDSQRNMHERN